MKLILLSLLFFAGGCKSVTVDKIIIKSPNWLPGVDIHLDVKDDVLDDVEAQKKHRIPEDRQQGASTNLCSL